MTFLSIALLFNELYKFGSSYAATAMGMWQPDEYFVCLILWLCLGMD